MQIRLLSILVTALYLPIYSQLSMFNLYDRYEYVIISRRNHFTGKTITHYAEILTIDSVSQHSETQCYSYTRTNIKKKTIEIDWGTGDSIPIEYNDTLSCIKGVYIFDTDKFCSIEEDTGFVVERSAHLNDTFQFIDPCSYVNESASCYLTEPDRSIIFSSDSNATICGQNTIVLQGNSSNGVSMDGENCLSLKYSPDIGIVSFRMEDFEPHGLATIIWDKYLYKVNGQVKAIKQLKNFARSVLYKGNSCYFDLSGREIKPNRFSGKGIYLVNENVKYTKVLIDLNK